MRKLHWQIFRALALTGISCVLLALFATWLFRDESRPMPRVARDIGALIVSDLPEHPGPELDRALRRRARQLHASISVWDRHGRLVGRAGRPLRSGRRVFPLDHDESMFVELDDGRSLAVAFEREHAPFGPRLLAWALFVLFLALLFGSHVAARRITRRLELLERGVKRFGEGDLNARVHVRGRDEIARLAGAFNRSSERIAGLLKQQRRMLQSASHELRSPLARLRMAFELSAEPDLPESERERIGATAARDIEELDQLIGDLLLAGRLSDSELPKEFSAVKLLEIAREEASRVGAEVSGEDLLVQGNPRMLKSLVRNLLENARRYGKDPIRVSLSHVGSELALCVDDEGAGVSEADRERIFEPFYRPTGHKEADGGVGLGLSLVKSIAEHHGGSVRYIARERGSRFEVRLPA